MFQRKLLLIMTAVGIFGVGGAAAADKTQVVKTQGLMAELNGVFSSLMPLVLSEKEFNSPANFKKIEKDALRLSELSRKVETHAPGIDPDLSLPLITNLFHQEAKRAADELKKGHRVYARSVLKSIPSFCIGCHTRSTAPEVQPKWIHQTINSLESRIEKGEFLAATRQFDKALDEFEAVISDPKSAVGRQVEWERAVRSALAVAVRVKADPARAIGIIDRVDAARAAPAFLKEDAARWKESLSKWAGEPKRTAQTEDGLYSEALRLMSTARAEQKYPADRGADMSYLRASAVLHELLRKYPDGAKAPDALFLLGMTYEVLRDMNIWSLHELYYMACIQKAPHSPIAETCYRRFEETTYAGYSGSGGVALPEDVKKQLEELRVQAATATRKSP